MRRVLFSLLLTLSLLPAGGCKKAPPPAESSLRPTATIKDLMDSLLDPAADVIWDSVSIHATAAGITYNQPKNDEEWMNVRRHAVQLLEAGNLLVIEGRRVAKTGEKAEDPAVELPPDEIERLIREDWPTWVRLAQGLYAAVLPVLKAVDAKDAQALLNAGEPLDHACENCHLKYWYPNDNAQGIEGAR